MTCIFLTGAAKGLGREMAIHFLNKKCKVFGVSREPVDPSDAILNNNPDFLFKELDINDSCERAEAVNAAVSAFGKIDVLINNAAIKLFNEPENISAQEYKDCINTNLTALILLTQDVLPHMRKQQSGRIINFASRAALDFSSNSTAYSASKAGVVAYSMSLAKAVKRNRIAVNVLCPPTITHAAYRSARPEQNHAKFLPIERLIAQVDNLVFTDKFVSGRYFPFYSLKGFLRALVLKNLEIFNSYFRG
jgi:short-subunit dehydrogenase